MDFVSVKELPKLMKDFRWALGLSQAKAAVKVGPRGVTMGTWYNWENGRCLPDLENAVHLGALLGVKILLPKKEAAA